jgi:hypothetical protein
MLTASGRPRWSVGAEFSPCRTWRYTLTRTLAPAVLPEPPIYGLGPFERLRTIAFIGLNPSTADETHDDPTVRRCLRFAERWGFERLVMLNIFALRSTDPKALRRAEDPIGPENDAYIADRAAHADLVVCCWGVHGLWHACARAFPCEGCSDREVCREAERCWRSPVLTRQEEVLALLREGGVEPWAFGFTKGGAPKHPLYLRADAKLVRMP